MIGQGGLKLIFGALSDAPRFELFGPAHWATLVGIAGVCLLVPLWARRLDDRSQETVARGIAVLILVEELLIKIPVRVGLFDFPLAEELPLHLCRLGAIAGAWLLMTRSVWAFDLVYFWALGGGLLALLTPDIRIAPPHIIYGLFYSGHALEILAVVYAMVVFGMRPHFRSVLRCMAVTQLLVLFLYPLNAWLGSNYLFLNRPPGEASILDGLGSGWVYLAQIEVVAAIFIVGFYLPFWLWDIRSGFPRGLLNRRSRRFGRGDAQEVTIDS